MSDETTTAAAAPKKPAVEITKVKMTDGREVDFAGKRNLNKDFTVGDNEVTARFDFRTGDTLSLAIKAGDPMLLQLAGHGLVQKAGDEAAGVKDEQGQPDVPSMVLAIESVLKRLANTDASVEDRWFAERAAGDGFSGASVVLKAIMEATKGSPKYPDGMSLEQVKAFLDQKLEAGKAEGLTRQKLYAAYRKPGSKTAAIIARMEQEKLAAATSSVDADADLAALTA